MRWANTAARGVAAGGAAAPAAGAPVGKAVLISNSTWGLVSYASQTVLLSAFFVILTRHYPAEEFAKFVIANALTQMFLAISALGLGNWFIREIAGAAVDRDRLVLKFLSTQVYSGVFFSALNIVVACVLYQDRSIRIIAALFAANIIFDNIINALKCLNIAEYQQRKTFVLLAFDALLKCAVAAALFVVPLSMITLAAILLATRIVTLNLFLALGTSGTATIGALLPGRHVSLGDVRMLLVANWPWIVIGGISVINWRAANIIISKRLSLTDTAVYEVAYRLFSIAQMVPVIVATAVYPVLVRLYNAGDRDGFRDFYRRTYVYYLLYGCVVFCFIHSYAGTAVPLIFGPKYLKAVPPIRQMFLTMVVFPTALLQGNVLFAMRLERRDMWLNLILLVLNVTMCMVGLAHVPSLTAITSALVISFCIFHVLQDVVLIRRGVSSIRHALSFHGLAAGIVLSYAALGHVSSSYLVFPAYWVGLLGISAVLMRHEYGLRAYMGRALAAARQ